MANKKYAVSEGPSFFEGSEFFPQLFKQTQPTPKNTVMAYVRAMPWKKKMALARDYFFKTFAGDSAIAKPQILHLFAKAKQNATVGIEITGHPLNKTYFRVFNEICPPVNAFFYELGLECYLVCGADLDFKQVKLTLGQNDKIEVE